MMKKCPSFVFLKILLFKDKIFLPDITKCQLKMCGETYLPSIKSVFVTAFSENTFFSYLLFNLRYSNNCSSFQNNLWNNEMYGIWFVSVFQCGFDQHKNLVVTYPCSGRIFLLLRNLVRLMLHIPRITKWGKDQIIQ